MQKYIFCLLLWNKGLGILWMYCSIMGVAFWNVNCLISESFFCIAHWRLHGYLHWGKYRQQRAVCKQRVSMGRLQKGDGISMSRNTNSEECAVFFSDFVLQNSEAEDCKGHPSVMICGDYWFCSLKFLLIFSFCKQGRAVYLEFFLASEFAIPFIFFPVTIDWCCLGNAVITNFYRQTYRFIPRIF